MHGPNWGTTLCIFCGALLVFLVADVRVSMTPEGSFHRLILERKHTLDTQISAALSPAVGEDFKPDLSFVANFTATSSSAHWQYGRSAQGRGQHNQIPYPSPSAGTPTQNNSRQQSEQPECSPSNVEWGQLEQYGCLARENVCADQNRFVLFDKRLQPGANFEEGLVFDHSGFHNIPGFPDNVRGAKTRFFPVLQRGNSTADPPDIQSPSFQACQVPLVWWPWWPFNPADVYLNSVLPLERMIREGIIEDTVQLVPVLDGLRPPRFHQWWFAPFSKLPVTPLADLSARTNAGKRCFQRMLFCNLRGLWNQPADGNWTAGLRPSGMGRKIVDYYLGGEGAEQPINRTAASATMGTLKVAIIERTKSRHILNLKDLLRQCNELDVGEGGNTRRVECIAVSFDDVGDFSALLAELQTIDILVGVHGAGLVNAYFLRPGSALVEIFPCRFSHPSLLFWPSQYFWHPSRQERQSYAFQIHMKYETRCKPSQLERNPAAVNYKEGPSFVQATLARDQDVMPDPKALKDVILRYAHLTSLPDSTARNLDRTSANYFVVDG